MPTGQIFQDGVPQASLASPGINNTATSIAAAAALTNWPASFPFTIAIDGGTSSMELVDVGGITGQTFTGCTRGVSGTTAVSHSTGANVTHVGTARDSREFRAHVDASSSNDSQGHSVHGLPSGSFVMGTSPAGNGSAAMSAGSTFTFDGAAAQPVLGINPQTYSPAFTGTGFSLGNGSVAGSYVRIGKVVYVAAKLTIGTTTNLGTGGVSFSLPVAPADYASIPGSYLSQAGHNIPMRGANVVSAATQAFCYYYSTGVIAGVVTNDSEITNTAPQAPGNGDVMLFRGFYHTA